MRVYGGGHAQWSSFPNGHLFSDLGQQPVAKCKRGSERLVREMKEPTHGPGIESTLPRRP